jgi:predicted transcriptional regulator
MSGPLLVTTREIKAARALLGWSQEELAKRSGVSEPTVARLEAVEGELRGRAKTVHRIKEALKAAGIEFLDERGGAKSLRFFISPTPPRPPRRRTPR